MSMERRMDRNRLMQVFRLHFVGNCSWVHTTHRGVSCLCLCLWMGRWSLLLLRKVILFIELGGFVVD